MASGVRSLVESARNGHAARSPSRKRRRSAEPEQAGFAAADVLADPENLFGYTFDDLICLPGHINFGVFDVSLTSEFTKRIRLQVPMVSSPMDTVTESRMAIAMALHGGIGCIHRNMTIDRQCAEVQKVKRFKAGMIMEPICIPPGMVLSDLDCLVKKCGFTGFPVTSDGSTGSKLLGLVTSRDTDFLRDRSVTVDRIMTKVEDLVATAPQGIGLEEANRLLTDSKKGKLPVVTSNGELVALICRADLKKAADYPLATKDAAGCLRVAAAAGFQAEDRERVKALVAAGADAIVMPHKHGHSSSHCEMVRWIKQEFPEVDVVGGNVVTRAAAARLIECNVDAIRVGMGTGSTSLAQEVTACGRPQASAVYHVASLANRRGVPVIADGGINGPGQILKALLVGANSVMCGNLLAGTEESAGEYIFVDGKRLKRYHGMGSLAAMMVDSCATLPASAAPAGATLQVAQGVSGSVVDRGPVGNFLPYIAQSLRHGLQDIGCRSVPELHSKLYNGDIMLEIRSTAAQREGGIHGLHSFENKLFAKA